MPEKKPLAGLTRLSKTGSKVSIYLTNDEVEKLSRIGTVESPNIDIGCSSVVRFCINTVADLSKYKPST